jgi:hypothetical protein
MMRAYSGRVVLLAVVVAGVGLACGSSKSSDTEDGGNETSTSSNPGGSTHSSTRGTQGSTGTSTTSASGGSTTSSTGDGGGGGSSSGSGSGSSSSSSGVGSAAASVLTYHNNLNRNGMYVEASLTKAVAATLVQDTGFTAAANPPLSGQNIYAQPLFVDGGASGTDLLFIATESNNVYALDAKTGAQVWTMNAGIPVPNSALSCGGLNPTGITGAPVIDFASRTIFFDAATFPNNGPNVKHFIFALSIDTGALKSGWPVDVTAKVKTAQVTTFDDQTHGERGALAILNGTLYVPFGGRDGDCNPYHGWVTAIPIDDPTTVSSWATTLEGGGVWAQGGVSSDGTDIYVATGNTFGGTSSGMWGGGEGIVRFLGGTTITSTPASFYAPTDWLTLDGNDADLGSAPVLFTLAGSTPSKLAISFGKDGNAYMVGTGQLNGVGYAIGGSGTTYSSFPASSGGIITAPALYTTPTATYVAYKGNSQHCTTGGGGDLSVLKITPGSPPSLSGSWCANGGNGSPIVTTTDGTNNAVVWNISGKLMGFDGDSGATIFNGGSVNLPGINTWMAPIEAKGRFIIAGNGNVIALKAP